MLDSSNLMLNKFEEEKGRSREWGHRSVGRKGENGAAVSVSGGKGDLRLRVYVHLHSVCIRNVRHEE